MFHTLRFDQLHTHQSFLFTAHHHHNLPTTAFHWPRGPKIDGPDSPAQRSYEESSKCMASPWRVKMVAKQIMRELSDMLLIEKVLQFVVLPEASLGADRYLSSLTTISDAEI